MSIQHWILYGESRIVWIVYCVRALLQRVSPNGERAAPTFINTINSRGPAWMMDVAGGGGHMHRASHIQNNRLGQPSRGTNKPRL